MVGSAMSELSVGEYTPAQMKASRILQDMGVWFSLEKVVRVYGEFDSENRLVFCKADILIDDPRFGSGVLEIDGSSHDTKGAVRKDTRKDAYYTKMWLWHERVKNEDVSFETIGRILKEHERKVDDYGGAV